MESCGVFKPMKTSEFDLCRFYQVGESRDFPKVPKPHEPAASNHVCGLLEKARKKGHLNLVVALSQDAVTAVSMLKKLHASISLQRLKMETPAEVPGKLMQKLSFYPFCQYCGSNDPSYLNHIICVHYKASFGCGRCLGEVYSTRQALSKHMLGCMGLKTGTTKGKSSQSPTKGAFKSPHSRKKHHHHKTLQQSLQVSSHSTLCCSEHTKKKTPFTSPRNPPPHSSDKDSGAKHSSNKHNKMDGKPDKKKMHKHTKQKK